MQRATTRARAKARRDATAKAALRKQRADRWLVAAATLLTLALVASFWFVTYVPAALGWSAQVLLLCLVVAAGAGRALLGQSVRAEETGGESEARWKRALLTWPVVALAAILPYLHSLNVGFLSDDFGLYYGASHATSAAHALSANALPGFLRPVAILLWWAGAKMWGGAPMGYHAANLLLHAGNAVLVYLLGKRWIGSSYAGFLAGMLFALHPLHVEPVVWICCNADLLCTFFCLLSLLGVEVALTGATTAWRRAAALAGSSVAFALALMSKEAALALPGVVFILLMVRGEVRRWQRTAAVMAPYVLLVVGYLAWRLLTLGSLGGYRVHLNLWNTVFPSAPLRHFAAFLFPVNRMLVATLTGPWLLYAMALVMVIGLHWWVRGLVWLPTKRLALWAGFLLVMAVPVWALPAATADLQHSRFAYLPTIGLAWLFGDLCTGRGATWRRSGAVALTALLVAGSLTAWYVVPWRVAHAKAEQVIEAGTGLLQQLEREQPSAVLYVQGLSGEYRGAQVMTNCLPQAVRLRLGRPAALRVVSTGGDVTPEVFALSTLMPNEYLAAWQDESGSFTLLRRGGGGKRPPSQGPSP